MKDKVFIIWSGSNETAVKIKRILEHDHNYICTIVLVAPGIVQNILVRGKQCLIKVKLL